MTDYRSSSNNFFSGGIIRFITVHKNYYEKVADSARFKDTLNVRE